MQEVSSTSYVSSIFILILGVITAVNSIDISQQDVSELVGLMSRDDEAVPGPIALGHKYMTGGAGEGSQRLGPESDFEEREQIKSDNVLPSYCEPPNPCPIGYTGDDGCLDDFDNSAEFSRSYQARQSCICDHEHMFNCLDKQIDELDQSLQSMLDQQGLHKNLIAKKFHQKRTQFFEPRRKRSVGKQQENKLKQSNPYFGGEVLKSVVKKDGRNVQD